MTRTLPILCALAACSGQSGLLIEISVRDAELAADLDRVVVRVEEAGQMMRQAELLKNGSEPPLFAERTVERVLYPPRARLRSRSACKPGTPTTPEIFFGAREERAFMGCAPTPGAK